MLVHCLEIERSMEISILTGFHLNWNTLVALNAFSWFTPVQYFTFIRLLLFANNSHQLFPLSYTSDAISLVRLNHSYSW